MFSENLLQFLRDFGVPCTAGAYAFRGILDQPDDTLNMGGTNVLSTMYVLQVQQSDVAAGAIASGTAISVDATAMGWGVLNFTVRDVLSLEDGAFNHLTLSK